MEKQIHENGNETQQVEKLSATEFYSQLETLLRKIPDGMVFVMNVCEDQDSPNPDAKSLVAMKGSMAKIAFAFHVAFSEDERFKNVITSSVDFANFNLRRHNSMPSMDIPSMLASILRK